MHHDGGKIALLYALFGLVTRQLAITQSIQRQDMLSENKAQVCCFYSYSQDRYRVSKWLH